MLNYNNFKKTLVKKMSTNEKKNEKNVKKKSVGGLALILSNRYLFMLHAFAYLAVNGLLVLIWALLFTSAPVFWPFFSLYGWGYGIGFHTIIYLMYNDKIKCLTKIREQSTFGILFVIHAFFYISVNVFLMILNLVSSPILYFLWPLLLWGMGFCVHAIGFFTWESFINKEKNKLKGKHPDFSEKRLKMKANLTIFNLWLVIIHALYYVVVNILIYTLWSDYIAIQIRTNTSSDPTIGWAIFLGLHLLTYVLLTRVESIKPVMKGLIVHIAAYIALNIYSICLFIIKQQYLHGIKYSLVLWGVILAFHVIIALTFDSMLKPAIEKAKNQFSGKDLEDFEIRAKAVNLLFWKWIFIMHVAVYIVGIILIGIDLAALDLLGLLLHPAMGWAIGVACHGVITIIILKPIKDFLTITALIHLTAYISVGVYLIILNVLLTPTFMWSVITLAGWGIGIGFHLLIWNMAKK